MIVIYVQVFIDLIKCIECAFNIPMVDCIIDMLFHNLILRG